NGCFNGRMRDSPCPEAWVCPVPEPVGLKVWANPHQSQPSCSRRAGWKRGRTAQNPPFFRRGSLQSHWNVLMATRSTIAAHTDNTTNAKPGNVAPLLIV